MVGPIKNDKQLQEGIYTAVHDFTLLQFKHDLAAAIVKLYKDESLSSQLDTAEC